MVPALLEYDLLYAIDTNTETIFGETLSVGCVVLCELSRDHESVIAEFAPIVCLELRNTQQNPEKLVWIEVIQQVIAHQDYNPSRKIGIIVDAHLNEIEYYNAGLVPISGSFYLPENFRLIYASADVGKEFLPNRLISKCDKDAKNLLRHINSQISDRSEFAKISNKQDERFRLWFPR